MPQINDIRELAQQNARYVSNSPQDWMSYLDVAARLYRYSFTDTLLIHAQRPDATACAEMELWNQKMSRWVNRGAKGIALLDDTGPRTRLRYVFDIADTHLVRGGRTPLLWNLDSHEHEQTILDHLADTYGLSQTDSMNTALMELAQQLTADNLDEVMDGLAYEVADTFLEELDEDNIRVRFRELMTNSIFYTLSRRCGQEPMDVLDDDDFIRIVDFNKLPVLSFLGNAVSEQCEAVLFDIGREMRKIYKKEITQQLEKSVDSLYNTNTDFSTLKRETKENTTKGGQENGVDVLPQGRLSVPESGREGRAADYREVRDAAQDVPEREPQELVSEYADERQTEPASGADRGRSGEPDGNPAGQPEREVSGTEQGERPAGMGGTSEQPDGDGRRNRLEGIGIQLTEPTTEQDLSEAEEEIASAFSFPDLPTVEQQIRAIEAPIQARYADEIALDSEVVDEILRTGSNRSKGQLRLIYNFMVEKTPEEYTEFVKNEYGTGGKGFEIDGAKYAVWFDDLGLRIAAGDTAKGGTIVNAFLSWEDLSEKWNMPKKEDVVSKGQQTVNLFSGIVRCGGCGQNMVRRTVSKNGKKYIYLHCVTNHNGLGCSSHLISESKLAEVVLAALQGKVQQISGLEHRLDEINEIPKNERRLKSVEEHLKMLEQEEQKYQTLRRQLYEDMSSGIVNKEEYKEFSHSFNEKVETIRKAKAEMNRQRDCLNNLDVEHLPWIEDFKSYQNLTSLNRRVLVELVESITVYDKEHIHIQYRFDQEIRNVLEYCSSVPAAETEESAV